MMTLLPTFIIRLSSDTVELAVRAAMPPCPSLQTTRAVEALTMLMLEMRISMVPGSFGYISTSRPRQRLVSSAFEISVSRATTSASEAAAFCARLLAPMTSIRSTEPSNSGTISNGAMIANSSAATPLSSRAKRRRRWKRLFISRARCGTSSSTREFVRRLKCSERSARRAASSPSSDNTRGRRRCRTARQADSPCRRS